MQTNPALPRSIASRPTLHLDGPHPDGSGLPFIHCFLEENKPLPSREKWAGQQQCAAHTGKEVPSGPSSRRKLAVVHSEVALGKCRHLPSSQRFYPE